MADNGKKKPRTRRYTQSPLYREAVALVERSKEALKAARASGDATRIAHAEKQASMAATAMEAANVQRFEHIAEMRGTTAARAIEDLTRLASQRRYPIKKKHADTIMSAINAAVADLNATLDAALTRTRETAPRRYVSFAPMQIDVEAFLKETAA